MPLILPVIDLKGGVVVRGVAGERDNYLPIQSCLCDSAAPGEVACALQTKFGFRDIYIADLDAIAGGPPACNDYQAIIDAGFSVWVDAGVANLSRARELADWSTDSENIGCIVIALETLESVEELHRIGQELDPDRLVFSLDLKRGQPLAVAPKWRSADPLAIVEDVFREGIRQMIVLDLASVGAGQGTGTEDLCLAIKQRWPDVELIGGGGVNSRAEIERLGKCGLSRVLVASALHDGRIV